MRFSYVRVKGYKGFYARLGLKELYIDFTKCTHNIIVIKGPNGVGKSTLIDLLHVMPDDNSKFLDNIPASKELGIISNGTEYKIYIKHPIKKNGNRDITKAYLSRKNKDNYEELNPNGNISSYKELVNSLFNIDPNYIYLSKLSADNRGLVDKSPAERKQIISRGNIINNIEVFNNMYKILNKKSSIFRNMINDISSKIDNIGNKKELESSLLSLENRIGKIIKTKETLVSDIAINKSKIDLFDPNKCIQNTYKDIYNKIEKVNKEISINTINIKNIEEKISINVDRDKITSIYNNLNSIVNKLETNVKVEESKVNKTLQDREDESKNLQIKTAKLDSLKIKNNYTDLNKSIKESKEKINKYLEIINRIGIKDIFNISKEEFILGLNSLKEIKENISVIYSNFSYDDIITSINCILNNNIPNIEKINDTINKLNKDYSASVIGLEKYNTLLEISNKLELRPTECKIDKCKFIKDSLEAIKKNPKKNIEILNNRIAEINKAIIENKEKKKESINITETINYLNTIIRIITNNINIINKLPINLNIYSNKKFILNAIKNKYPFNEVERLYQFIDFANIIEEYKHEYNKYKELANDIEVYKVKNEIIDNIIKDINDINNKMKNIQEEINNSNDIINKNNIEIHKTKDIIITLESLINLYRKDNELINDKKELLSSYDSIKSKMSKIKIYIDSINKNTNQLNRLMNELQPIMNDRDVIKHSLSLSKEYNEELKLYSTKYTKVQILKKYSSPTKKGIQLLFIAIYMNKILSLANRLLSLLFNGEYILKPFIINEKEFSIPCIGSRLLCDDISSMSGSQRCMISMIISFAILYQASTNFNIIRLDEIDYGLDGENRLRFFPVVQELMNILHVEQNFIITHNQEMDLSCCDIILLAPTEGVNESDNYNYIYKGDL